MYHLKTPLDAREAGQLIESYDLASPANASEWYPTLMEWPSTRYGHPLLFRLLNERYKITSPAGMLLFLALGIIIFGVCFALSLGFRVHGRFIFVPLALYGVICAKRFDFVDKSNSRYGYGG